MAFIVLFPLYISPSGRPQISTGILGLLLMVALSYGRHLQIERRYVPAASALMHFVAYTGVVSLAWALYLADPTMLLPVLYYGFNAMLVLLALHLHAQDPDRFIKFTLAAVLAAVAWQIALGFPGVAPVEVRQTLFFNNPNQLGYYGVLVTTMFALPEARRLPMLARTAGLALGAFTALLGVSSSATLSLVLVVLVAIVATPRNTLALGTALTAIVLVFLPITQEAVTDRLQTIGESRDDSMEGRGYDRIVDHPKYLIFGAGEGAYDRFDSGVELHSTPGTLVFAYGVVGALLFLRFGRGVWLSVGGRRVIFLLPGAFYGLTHQGLRFSMLWVLVALLLVGRSEGVAVVPLTARLVAFGSRRQIRMALLRGAEQG